MNLELILNVAGLSVALWGATYAAQNLYDRTYTRYRQFRADRLSYLERQQALALNRIRVLYPDEHGRAGIVYDGKVYRDLDSRAVFTQELNRFFDPLLERLNQQHKLLLGLQGLAGNAVTQALAATHTCPGGQCQGTPLASPPWPDVVRLTDLFIDKPPSIHDLVIGVRPTETGLDVVSESLHDLMHTLAVGASGWGKSTWLRALLWQVARASEAIEIVAVDTSGSEFNVLRDWGKLTYPVARTTQDAVALLGAVSDEIGRRKVLFEQNAPIASKLTEYNAATGAGLPPWLVVVDEGTNLLNQSGVGEPLRVAVQTARQYGVYVLLAGQSAKHNVIDTQVRDNFSSRLCFRTSPASSRVVLDDKAASELTHKGRMVAQLVGQEQVELQGPFVGRQELMEALGGGGPAWPVPESPCRAESERVRELAQEGLAPTAIAEQVFGYKNARTVERVRAILDSVTG